MTKTKRIFTGRGYYHVGLVIIVGGTITIIHEVLYRLSAGDKADLDAFGIASHGTGDMVMVLAPIIVILWFTEFMRHRTGTMIVESK